MPARHRVWAPIIGAGLTDMAIRGPHTNALLIAVAIIAAPPVLAQVQTFQYPQHDGSNVSYCGAGNSSCGERVAAAWCRTSGYEFASDWAAGSAGNSTGRAISLDDGVVCEGATCEVFAHITCGSTQPTFTRLVPGAAERSTILSPSRRSTVASLDAAELRVLIPGCSQRDPGVFVCESILDYQHCRSLMQARMLYSCRAALVIDEDFAEARATTPDDYVIEIDSDAYVRVTQGSRGAGQVKGKAEVELTIKPPVDDSSAWCLQRDQFLFFPTGPMGGVPEIGESADCGEPMEFSFEPHEDDLTRAYDLCDSFVAWGETIDDRIDILAAGLFQVRSASPTFVSSHGGGSAVIAPFVQVEAPLTIDCRD